MRGRDSNRENEPYHDECQNDCERAPALNKAVLPGRAVVSGLRLRQDEEQYPGVQGFAVAGEMNAFGPLRTPRVWVVVADAAVTARVTDGILLSAARNSDRRSGRDCPSRKYNSR